MFSWVVGQVDAVMIGRAAYHNPYLLAAFDTLFFGGPGKPASRLDIIEQLKPYVLDQLNQQVYLKHMTRHILGLFQGQPGARKWRQVISKTAHLEGADFEVIKRALDQTL